MRAAFTKRGSSKFVNCWPALPQPNVSNPAGAPYYYTGSTAGANLYTNTSISVDTRLTYSELTDLLNTAAVAASIQSQISGGERARQ